MQSYSYDYTQLGASYNKTIDNLVKYPKIQVVRQSHLEFLNTLIASQEGNKQVILLASMKTYPTSAS